MRAYPSDISRTPPATALRSSLGVLPGVRRPTATSFLTDEIHCALGLSKATELASACD